MTSFTKHPVQELDAIDEYVNTFRRPGLPELEISNLLDLFPNDPVPVGFQGELTWADPWPFGRRPGVYLVYDAAMHLIYIGKASVIGERLYHYFGGGDECILRQEWGIPPRFLGVEAVPDAVFYEAPALEAFLIWKLQPQLNTHGKK